MQHVARKHCRGAIVDRDADIGRPDYHAPWEGSSLTSRTVFPTPYELPRLGALEPQVRRYCADSLDPLIGRGRFDFVADLGAQMPMRVIGMLLGIPEQDQIAVRNRTDANLRTEPGQPMDVHEDKVARAHPSDGVPDWREAGPVLPAQRDTARASATA